MVSNINTFKTKITFTYPFDFPDLGSLIIRISLTLPQLFDLKNDPDELINLAKQRPDLVEYFENLVTEKRKTTHTESYQDQEENEEIEEQVSHLGHI